LEIGTALYEVGNNLFQLSLFDIALDAYQSALDRFQTITTSPSLSLSNTHIPLIAASHYAIGLILLFTEMENNHKRRNSKKPLRNQRCNKHLTLKAIESLKAALYLWATQYGPNNEYTGQTNHWLGLACQRLGSNTEAKTYLTESLRIRKLILNHLGYADTLHEIAYVHHILGEHCESVECYQGALKTKKECKVHDDDFPRESLALSLDEMQKVYSKMDMNEDANECFTESSQLTRQSSVMADLTPEIVNPRSGGGSANGKVGGSIDNSSNHSKSGTVSSTTAAAGSNTNDASISSPSSVGIGTEALKRFSININPNNTHGGSGSGDDYELMNMGRMQFKNGDYEYAISSFKSCLRISNQKPGDNVLEIADIFSALAITHLLLNDESFKHYHEQAIRLFNSKFGHNNLKAALCLHNMGCAHARKKRLEDSLSCFEDALRLRILHLGNHEDVAITLLNMAFVLCEQKEYFMSLERLNESKEIMELRLGSQHKMVAEITHHIGYVYDLKGDQSNALAWYEKTLVLKKIAYSDDDVVLGIDYNCIGNIFYDRKEYEVALVYLENALRVRQAHLPEDNLEIATSLYDIGYVYHDMGKTADAINFLERVLKMRKLLLGCDYISVGDTNNSLGFMYAKQGDHVKALASLDEALRIRQLNEAYEKLADTLNNMGIVHRSAGDIGKAIGCYEEALRFRQKCACGNGMKSDDIYFNLGNLYDGTNSNEKAMECYNHALRGRMEAFGENSNHVAAVLSNMCFVHFKLGERDMALAKLEEVLRIRKHTFGDDHEEVATAYYNLGVLHLRRGELPIARVRFEDALESFRAIGIGDSNQTFANALQNVSLIGQQLQNASNQYQ